MDIDSVICAGPLQGDFHNWTSCFMNRETAVGLGFENPSDEFYWMIDGLYGVHNLPNADPAWSLVSQASWCVKIVEPRMQCAPPPRSLRVRWATWIL